MVGSEKLIEQLDIDYSYQLARKMEKHCSNPVLGYRPAGSEAERLTGEMLREEMLSIGLTNVRREEFSVDGWEFHHAELIFETPEGKRKAVLGAYQTTLQTDGWETCRYTWVGAKPRIMRVSMCGASWCWRISIRGMSGGLTIPCIRRT